jgi:hypothetical protein
MISRCDSVDAMKPRLFQAVDAVEDERRDRQQRQHDQPGADAENRLGSPRRLARLCLIVQHPSPSVPVPQTSGHT